MNVKVRGQGIGYKGGQRGHTFRGKDEGQLVGEVMSG